MLPTGLGLSVAYGIVRRHGGELSLESRQGAGTTARMWLPARPGAVATEEEAAATAAAGATATATADQGHAATADPRESPLRVGAGVQRGPGVGVGAASLAGVRILLVEDDEITREATGALLQHAGLEVTEAASGLEAIQLFGCHDYDLVLSDLGMPDHDGWSVAAAVKRRCPNTPVALITGWGHAISDDERRARGVDVIVRKPVDPQRLLDHLTELLAT